MTRRVVITGMAGITPIGQDWETILDHLRARRSGVLFMEEWGEYDGMHTRLGAPVTDFVLPKHYTRKVTRSMGRVALLAVRASEWALTDAGLLGHPAITSGRTGVAYGSSMGSAAAITDFGKMLLERRIGSLTANSYLRMMGHTTAVNISVFFKTQGRILPSVSACVSGSQGIGFAFEAISAGAQDIMIAGGADELCPTAVAVFDTLYATSTRNQQPDSTPRPFDQDRDGLVLGEGAGTLILEELQHARSRGAKIYAEIVGFGTNSDGAHVTQPTQDTMQNALELALQQSGLSRDAIGYVSAHGTSTEQGDIAESHATLNVFGPNTPISTLKSYTGHTLGACGALEAWVAIQMMRSGEFHPTINLDTRDPRCAELDYIVGSMRPIECEYVMSNNFAFGGINTSLIFKRWDT